jgi:hypothetical protein
MRLATWAPLSLLWVTKRSKRPIRNLTKTILTRFDRLDPGVVTTAVQAVRTAAMPIRIARVERIINSELMTERVLKAYFRVLKWWWKLTELLSGVTAVRKHVTRVRALTVRVTAALTEEVVFRGWFSVERELSPAHMTHVAAASDIALITGWEAYGMWRPLSHCSKETKKVAINARVTVRRERVRISPLRPPVMSHRRLKRAEFRNDLGSRVLTEPWDRVDQNPKMVDLSLLLWCEGLAVLLFLFDFNILMHSQTTRNTTETMIVQDFQFPAPKNKRERGIWPVRACHHKGILAGGWSDRGSCADGQQENTWKTEERRETALPTVGRTGMAVEKRERGYRNKNKVTTVHHNDA